MTENTAESYMTQALALALLGRDTVSPNPMVGCLLVKNNQIIGQGWHQYAGQAHAEVFALREAGAKAQGATVYLTLEPCCHEGRTPPCTAALIAAGVQKVYVACLDPNPLVSGKGVAALQAAGIEVELGLLAEQAKQMNEIFFHYIQHKKPLVLVKWAMSLDGKTTTHPQDSRQISGREAQAHTHQIRRQVDAILVGSKTAIQDNPQLTVRDFDGQEPILKQPLRVVLSSKGNLPLNLKLVDGSLPGKTLVATTRQAPEAWREALTAQGNEVLVLPEDEQGHIHLPSLLADLGKREISSILVEGGMAVHASFFNEGLVNKIQVYMAPTIIGALSKKRPLTKMAFSPLGPDFSFSANLEDH